MKRLRWCCWTVLCLCFLVAFAPSPAQAEDDPAPETVKVGWYEDSYHITGANGERTGYAYEYEQAVAGYTGWSYEYVKGNWDELLNMLADGKIDMMGGTIDIQSEPGRGSRFEARITLPLDEGAKDAASDEGDDTPTGSVLRGKRFLCAEDNELNAEILKAILEMEGADCTIYPDGSELVKAFASVSPGEYDAILMDMQMPVMNGVEATKAVRSGDNPLGRTIPIIAMTANAFAEDVKRCLDAGMDAHIAKPLDVGLLERTLKDLTDRKPTKDDGAEGDSKVPM